MPREFQLDEILTEDEIVNVMALYKKATRRFHDLCLERIVEPAWDRIVQVLGPCSARFVVYGIEYRCLKCRKTVKSVHKHDGIFNRGRHHYKRKERNEEVNRNQWDRNLYQENPESERPSL